MKACVYHRYGGPEVVEIRDLPTPVPQPGELLIRIHASTVSAGDWRMRSLAMPRGFAPFARLAIGITGPRQPILGGDFAGIVAAIGAGVTRFAPGDAVFGFPGIKLGCHAQYRVLAETGSVLPKPATLDFDAAASLPCGAMTALHYLRKAANRPADRVLVVGASGAVGSALVQLALHSGAEVTAVASTPNLGLVTSLGAHHAIDYTTTDVTAGPAEYDIIADTVGATPFSRYRRILRPGGRLLAIAAGLPDMLAALWAPLYGRRVIVGPASEALDDLRQIASLAEQGALRPVIDRHYDMSAIAAAHAYVATGRKRGSVVVRIERGDCDNPPR